jgi:threonine dehydrogenase-like Zn-dependent dehydrogenase
VKAVIFDGALRVAAEHPAPAPGPGEALVRVRLAGICRTDLEVIRGYMAFRGILGHEFAGVVERAGDESLVGRRVVGDINLACGRCTMCRRGLRTHCPGRTVMGIAGRDGCMAEMLALPVENLLVVPDRVADEEAVFTEPLAAAFEIAEQVHLRPTDRVLVMGDGRLGLLSALALAPGPADVTLTGKHEEKLAIARAQGVRTMLRGTIPGGERFDVVVEATGRAEGFQEALGLVRPRGTVVLKTTVAAGSEMTLSPVVVDEVTVVGSRCGPFGPALRALEENRLDVRPLVSATFPAESAVEAFERAGKPGVIKVLLDFRGTGGRAGR